MTILKICGITNIKDRDLCLEEGVDLIGFNIYKNSARYVDDAKLSELLAPAINKSVIVGVDSEWGWVIKNYSPHYIQLHGNETMDIIKSIKDKFPEIQVIKKVTIGSGSSTGSGPSTDYVSEFEDILSIADYLLCDVASDGSGPSTFHGGTGKRFNWEKLKSVSKNIREKLFVAGGINPDNIDDVLKYDVFGVDVATGSESLPGKKNQFKIKQLVEAVRKYNE